MEEQAYLTIKNIDIPLIEDLENMPVPLVVGEGEDYWTLEPGKDEWNQLTANTFLNSRFYNDPLDGVAKYAKIGVRPILFIEGLDEYNLTKYQDSVEIFGKDWVYIGNNELFASKTLFTSKFDHNTHDYDDSYLKYRLENWLKYNLKEFNED